MDRSAVLVLGLGAIALVVRPLVADLLATFCFYAAYAATDSVGVATILAAALGAAQLVWALAGGRAVPPIQWASLILVVAVGAMSLSTGDARYVLYKASIIYLVIGLAMLRPGWLLRYLPPIAEKYLSERVIIGFGYATNASTRIGFCCWKSPGPRSTPGGGITTRAVLTHLLAG